MAVMYFRVDAATKYLVCSSIKFTFKRVIQMIVTLMVLGMLTHTQVWAEDIEKAVALEISQLEFLQATNAFLLSIL